MGYGTKIEWAHHTYNPWIGCTRISPACDHCYAADWDKRYHGGEHWGAGAPRRRTSPQTRNAPYRWARQARATGERPRVFCCSLADVFDNEVPAEWREDLWQVIRDTPELDWLLLTKRIGNVRQMLPEDWGSGWSHVWLGITVVTQAEADRDIPKLLDTPAAIRWLSIEPLLEPVDLTGIRRSSMPWDPPGPSEALSLNALQGRVDHLQQGCRIPEDCPCIDWIVAGGESGSKARPMHPDWARSLRDQCAAAGVPFLFKQWGEWAPFEWGALTGVQRPQDEQCMSPDGSCVYAQAGHAAGFRRADDALMARVGKKAAGRLLDGRTYDEVPRACS